MEKQNTQLAERLAEASSHKPGIGRKTDLNRLELQVQALQQQVGQQASEVCAAARGWADGGLQRDAGTLQLLQELRTIHNEVDAAAYNSARRGCVDVALLRGSFRCWRRLGSSHRARGKGEGVEKLREEVAMSLGQLWSALGDVVSIDPEQAAQEAATAATEVFATGNATMQQQLETLAGAVRASRESELHVQHQIEELKARQPEPQIRLPASPGTVAEKSYQDALRVRWERQVDKIREAVEGVQEQAGQLQSRQEAMEQMRGEVAASLADVHMSTKRHQETISELKQLQHDQSESAELLRSQVQQLGQQQESLHQALRKEGSVHEKQAIELKCHQDHISELRQNWREQTRSIESLSSQAREARQQHQSVEETMKQQQVLLEKLPQQFKHQSVMVDDLRQAQQDAIRRVEHANANKLHKVESRVSALLSGDFVGQTATWHELQGRVQRLQITADRTSMQASNLESQVQGSEARLVRLESQASENLTVSGERSVHQSPNKAGWRRDLADRVAVLEAQQPGKVENSRLAAQLGKVEKLQQDAGTVHAQLVSSCEDRISQLEEVQRSEAEAIQMVAQRMAVVDELEQKVESLADVQQGADRLRTAESGSHQARMQALEHLTQRVEQLEGCAEMTSGIQLTREIRRQLVEQLPVQQDHEGLREQLDRQAHRVDEMVCSMAARVDGERRATDERVEFIQAELRGEVERLENMLTADAGEKAQQTADVVQAGTKLDELQRKVGMLESVLEAERAATLTESRGREGVRAELDSMSLVQRELKQQVDQVYSKLEVQTLASGSLCERGLENRCDVLEEKLSQFTQMETMHRNAIDLTVSDMRQALDVASLQLEQEAAARKNLAERVGQTEAHAQSVQEVQLSQAEIVSMAGQRSEQLASMLQRVESTLHQCYTRPQVDGLIEDISAALRGLEGRLIEESRARSSCEMEIEGLRSQLNPVQQLGPEQSVELRALERRLDEELGELREDFGGYKHLLRSAMDSIDSIKRLREASFPDQASSVTRAAASEQWRQLHRAQEVGQDAGGRESPAKAALKGAGYTALASLPTLSPEALTAQNRMRTAREMILNQ